MCNPYCFYTVRMAARTRQWYVIRTLTFVIWIVFVQHLKWKDFMSTLIYLPKRSQSFLIHMVHDRKIIFIKRSNL